MGRVRRQRGQHVEGPGNGGDVVPCRNREWAGRPGMPGSWAPPGIFTRTPCPGLDLYLKKNRKLPKVVSKGKAHICVLERPPWLQQGATELEGTRRDGTGNGYGNDGSVS